MLTLVLLPSVRASADKLVTAPQAQAAAPIQTMSPSFPGILRPAALEISPIHSAPMQVATMPRPEVRSPATGPTASERELPKPRRFTREGCEAPLSSLVGPEARRMVPGRCMA